MRMNRRSFIISSAAVTGGLAIGFNPFETKVDRPADGSPEINAWVVIQPNDTVVIRIFLAIAGLVSLGTVAWAYVLLWVLMPERAGEVSPAAKILRSVKGLFTPSGIPTRDPGV